MTKPIAPDRRISLRLRRRHLWSLLAAISVAVLTASLFLPRTKARTVTPSVNGMHLVRSVALGQPVLIPTNMVVKTDRRTDEGGLFTLWVADRGRSRNPLPLIIAAIYDIEQKDRQDYIRPRGQFERFLCGDVAVRRKRMTYAANPSALASFCTSVVQTRDGRWCYAAMSSAPDDELALLWLCSLVDSIARPEKYSNLPICDTTVETDEDHEPSEDDPEE